MRSHTWTSTVLAWSAATILVAAASDSQRTVAAVPVTADNFIRAETDLYFGNAIKDAGGTGRLYHHRELMPIARQTVIRSNRDTLYSAGVFDLDAGPVTITLPDTGSRFRSMQVINEDHYVIGDVIYRPGAYSFDRARMGTRYGLIALRLFVNPNDPKDVQEAHRLQDATTIEQKGGPGKFEIPRWDPASQKRIRDALLVLSSTITDFKGAFGNKGQVDPVRRLLGSASGWGGNPDKDAVYLNVTPPQNDGIARYRITVKDVPVDGFWSVSVYNAQGYYVPNPFNANTINDVTARKSSDGSVTIQFGGCDGKIPNCLPIMRGWNYTVRLYRPRSAILTNSWKFPEPVSIK